MKVSLNRAAKENNISLPTLSNWRKKGLISAEKAENGRYIIDVSEYDRIQEIKKQSSHISVKIPKALDKDNVKVSENLHKESNSFNDAEKDFLQEKIALLEERISEIKEQRDDWKKQAQTLLISHEKPIEKEKIQVDLDKKSSKVIPEKKGFFRRMFS